MTENIYLRDARIIQTDYGICEWCVEGIVHNLLMLATDFIPLYWPPKHFQEPHSVLFRRVRLQLGYWRV